MILTDIPMTVRIMGGNRAGTLRALRGYDFATVGQRVTLSKFVGHPGGRGVIKVVDKGEGHRTGLHLSHGICVTFMPTTLYVYADDVVYELYARPLLLVYNHEWLW